MNMSPEETQAIGLGIRGRIAKSSLFSPTVSLLSLACVCKTSTGSKQETIISLNNMEMSTVCKQCEY